MKYILLIFMLSTCATAQVAIKANFAIARGSKVSHSATKIVSCNVPTLAYQDDRTYVEAELLEINDQEIILRLLIGSKLENNPFTMRGMPKISVPITQGLGMTSMNCDGKEEHFTIIISVSI